jgi:nucleoid-associated protein YgaU
MQYRIRRGDTFWGLAGRFLGDPARWRELWQRHQQAAAIGLVPAIADPDRLRIGQPLLLPTDPETGAGVRYHVVPGDTLSGIARRIYGDPARWPQIQRDNGLADPHRIVPRQVLHLRPPA